jgi:exopolyphosphatase/pppGpp-phosphohydrolase
MNQSDDRGVVLALGSLAVGALMFLFAEMRVALCERAMLKGQVGQMGRRLRDIKTSLQKTEEAVQRRDHQLKKAEEIDAFYEGLLTELIELAQAGAAGSGAPASTPRDSGGKSK